MKAISCLANIIWIIMGGITTALVWFLAGLLLCVTIVGIPFGLQCFKFARLTFAPFGKTVRLNFGRHPIVNTVWLLIFGIPMFVGYIASAIACFATIIGIPAGIAAIKFSILSLAPFGAQIN